MTKRCPYCARGTFYGGVYCGLCARLIWNAKSISGLILITAGLLIALLLLIDLFSPESIH